MALRARAEAGVKTLKATHGASLRRLSGYLGITCAALGFAVLIGWAGGIVGLTTVVPGLAPMTANTASCFVLSGAALWLRTRTPLPAWAEPVARVLAGVVALVGAAITIEYLTHHALGVDTWLFGAAQRAQPFGLMGRMSAGTAVSFLVLGTATLFLERDWGDWLAVLPASLALVNVIGYLDSLLATAHLISYSSMALHTAVGLGLLSVSVVLARPDRGVTPVLLDRGPAGQMARRMMPATYLVPLIIAALIAWSQRTGILEPEIAGGLTIVGMIVALSVLAMLTVMRVRDTDLERAAAAADLHAANARYRDLFDSSPIGLFHSLPDGTILNGNPALVRLLGLPDRNSLLSRNAAEFYADPEARRAFVEELSRVGHVAGMEIQFKAADGVVRWVVVHANAVRDDTGAVRSLTGSFIDVTERKKVEQQFLAAQRLEAVGRLAGGVAHDFNNLLTVLNADGEFLLQGIPEDHPNRPDVEEILATTQRAATLTRQLLAFSRRQVLEPRVLDLNDVVLGMDKLLRRIIGEDIQFVTIKAPALAAVRADPGQIEQVVVNLAVNAKDAMPGGGKLLIETSNVSLDDDDVTDDPDLTPGHHVLLSVSDTGQGMSQDVVARIFEPFFTTKTMGKGTGLGLSTVYGIIRQSGGHIRVYSERGVGTTFKVYLPAVAGDASAPVGRRRATEIPVARPGETVLVVDDNTEVRTVAARTLRQLGYVVLDAADAAGAFAVAAAHGRPVDLLLTDVVMPRVSGAELAKEFRRRYPSTRVLFTSGYTDEAARREELVAEGAAFIQKPFTIESLGRKVHDVLHG